MKFVWIGLRQNALVIASMLVLGGLGLAFNTFALPCIDYAMHFQGAAVDGCEAELEKVLGGLHRFPDDELGWTAKLTITPKRIPCSARFSLTPALHEIWYCCGAEGEGAFSVDRAANAMDFQEYTEIEVTAGKIGEPGAVLVFFRRREGASNVGNPNPGPTADGRADAADGGPN